MKSRKGFTLVELLAVIVIMAIIIFLATTGYGTIKNKILERQYKNLES